MYILPGWFISSAITYAPLAPYLPNLALYLLHLSQKLKALLAIGR